jgi:pimeloyl-ACP methyl ester carboxylesterase
MTLTTALLTSLVSLPAATPLTFGAAFGVDEPVDTLIRVRGHDLHFILYRGTVPVTILLEAGGGADLTSWAGVPKSLAKQTGATVVAYDRAGLGGSGPGPAESRPEDEIGDLNSALNCLRVPERTIVVAHSYGAMLALLSARHWTRVAGLVLVDPMNSRFVEATGDFLYTTVLKVDNPTTERERTIVRMVATFPDLTREVSRLEPGLPQPMVVITAGEPWWGREDIDRAWRRSHEALAAAGKQRRLVVAEGSDHGVPEERPEVIVSAVQELLKLVGRPSSARKD